MLYNMFHNYMLRPFSFGRLQVVYTRPSVHNLKTAQRKGPKHVVVKHIL